MAKEQKGAKPEGGAAATAEKCKFEECKAKSEKFGFCMQHYDWYMEGVIRGDGHKPSDFAEKFARYAQKKPQRKVA